MNTIASPISVSRRRTAQDKGQRVKLGKLAGVMAYPFLAGESGIINQTVAIELNKIMGELESNIWAKVTSVYVPVQAVDALLNDADPNSGITEILRRKVMDGTPLFTLENEGEITKRLNINPKPIGGNKRVSSVARIAYNVAVNHLRRRRYIYADVLTAANAVVTPAIINETVLDKYNAALDPDEHINGNVSLRLSDTDAPLKGIYQTDNSVVAAATPSFNSTAQGLEVGHSGNRVGFKRKAGNPAGTSLDIWADLSEVAAEGISLVDLYNAQNRDKLVRRMREIADANPEDGEDAILRWVYGLSTDTGQHPFVVYEERKSLVDMRQNAVDGAGMVDDIRTAHVLGAFQANIVVPRTELGGVVITLVQVTPDEYIDQMPHPILTDDWSVANRASAAMKMDPEIVIAREMYADVSTPAGETLPLFYTGHNERKRNYVDYGFSRQVDPSTVENKTVMWQYAIPAGVTPSNILYPETFVQYPFADQNAENALVRVKSTVSVATNMFFGPSPVETVAIVDDENIFDEE